MCLLLTKVYCRIPLLIKSFRGFFAKGEMQREFEDAAFKLQPGSMSGIVETASGLHLIER